jgi:hypothetical protein
MNCNLTIHTLWNQHNPIHTHVELLISISDYDISDVDEDNDLIQMIWPALSQCNIIGEQTGSTSALKDQPHSILTSRRHRHTSGVSISSSTGNQSFPLITPDKIRHTSEFSDRLGDCSGNSAMSAVIPHVGQSWVGYKLSTGYSFFSSPCQRQCELLPSLGVRRLSSVNFSHFNLLLWNPYAKWTETW